MEGSMRIDLDKLPIKRLAAIEESGIEHFPPEVDYEEKRLNAIWRVDFSSVIERDAKKPKSSKESSSEKASASASAAPEWPWKSMVENLQLGLQELSVIIDLINTVEDNDAVTVSGMQKPKLLPNELLPDLAVSAATKLQRLRHLGRYFKQSSKALEEQVTREARFYGSLIRLQQNWEIKRHRLATTGPGNEGFTVDLLDNSMLDLATFSRSSPLSTVRIDQDSAGILAVQVPLKLSRSIDLGFLGVNSSYKSGRFIKRKRYGSSEHPREVKKEALTEEDVNECVKESHSILREIHQSIFQEQVFEMVNRETYNPSPVVNVTGMQEDFLRLAIGQDTSVCLSLAPTGKEDDSQTIDSTGQVQNGESGASISDSSELMVIDEKHSPLGRNLFKYPNEVGLEIYLQNIYHENIHVKAKEKWLSTARLPTSSKPTSDACGLLGHFCLTIAHRIFSNKVLIELERLVGGVSYLHLLSHPTWHSRTSSWSLSLKVPQSILHAGRQIKPSDTYDVKTGYKSQFHTKVSVNDDRITVSGEGAPSIIVSYGGSYADVCAINCYGCVLEDLPMILLQQIASQVIHWLHEEALLVGIKANKDFLGLYFDLDQADMLGLVAHVDPDDVQGCISWWLVMDGGSPQEENLSSDNAEPANRRYLGHLSIEALYSMLMDVITLCSNGGSH